MSLMPYTGCDCCLCVAPRLLARIRSAGGSKRGFRPNTYLDGIGSVAGKFYLSASQSGSVVCYTPPADPPGDCASDHTMTLSVGGSMSVDAETGAVTGSMSCTTENAYSDPCGGTASSSTSYHTGFDSLCGDVAPHVDSGGTYSLPAGGGCSGALTLTMGSEFTDAMLLARHPLPEYGDFIETAPFARYFLNGATLSRAVAEYKFAFPVPGNGLCYRLTWNEVTYALTDEGYVSNSVAPIYVAKSYEWDRQIPNNYDPADMATWPTTPTYELPLPTRNEQTRVYTTAYPEDPDEEAPDPLRIFYSCDRCT